jgi:hypothetical protein
MEGDKKFSPSPCRFPAARFVLGASSRPKTVEPANPEETTMDTSKSPALQDWRAARTALVAELTRLRDQLSTDPCALPWVTAENTCVRRMVAA